MVAASVCTLSVERLSLSHFMCFFAHFKDFARLGVHVQLDTLKRKACVIMKIDIE